MSKPEIAGVVVYIKDKRTNDVSKPIPIPDIIFNQHDVEFEFDDDKTLPYNDFLFYQEDYDVTVRVIGVDYDIALGVDNEEEEDYE
jgi:hypothetical protein